MFFLYNSTSYYSFSHSLFDGFFYLLIYYRALTENTKDAKTEKAANELLEQVTL